MLVEIAGAEGLRVTRAELKDVSHLDRRLDGDRMPVDQVANLDPADVGTLEAEVAARLHTPQVRVGTVRAGDVGAFADRVVEQDREAPVEASRSDEPRWTKLDRDLRFARRPPVAAADLAAAASA